MPRASVRTMRRALAGSIQRPAADEEGRALSRAIGVYVSPPSIVFQAPPLGVVMT